MKISLCQSRKLHFNLHVNISTNCSSVLKKKKNYLDSLTVVVTCELQGSAVRCSLQGGNRKNGTREKKGQVKVSVVLLIHYLQLQPFREAGDPLNNLTSMKTI